MAFHFDSQSHFKDRECFRPSAHSGLCELVWLLDVGLDPNRLKNEAIYLWTFTQQKQYLLFYSLLNAHGIMYYMGSTNGR